MYLTFKLCVSHPSVTNVTEPYCLECKLLAIYVLTSHGKASQRTGLRLGLTHPLLAALAGHLDPPGHGAVRSGQHHVHVASRHAGDLPVAAHALVLTAREEGLAAVVDGAVQDTHAAQLSWKSETRERFDLEGNRTPAGYCHCPLTSTDARPSVDIHRVVTLQTSLCVTGVQVGADLPLLPGTHQAADAVVQDQGHPRGAHGWLLGALASPRTHLGPG